MPDTQGPVLTNGPPRAPEGATQNGRVSALARLAIGSRAKGLGGATTEEEAQFNAEFMGPVEAWCRAHADQVSACYVKAHEGLPAVFVISRTEPYAFSFGQLLTGLDNDLHRRGWRCFVLEFPPGFVDEANALRIVPNSSEAEHAHP